MTGTAEATTARRAATSQGSAAPCDAFTDPRHDACTPRRIYPGLSLPGHPMSPPRASLFLEQAQRCRRYSCGARRNGPRRSGSPHPPKGARLALGPPSAPVHEHGDIRPHPGCLLPPSTPSAHRFASGAGACRWLPPPPDAAGPSPGRKHRHLFYPRGRRPRQGPPTSVAQHPRPRPHDAARRLGDPLPRAT
jgi:hypothetical protein